MTLHYNEDLYEILKDTETKSKKFHEIETKILTILNFNDLFEVLLMEIKQSFNVPYVWLSLIAKSEILNYIKAFETSEVLNQYLNIIDQDTFLNIIGNKDNPILENTNLKPFIKLLPPNRKYLIKSIAVTPIFLDGEIIGSFNQADHRQNRFMPNMDITFLKQLAIKVSICLSNVTAHEKLKFMAYYDPLTKLLNRRVMESVLKREFNRAKRYSNSLSVVFLDMNDFKDVNDTYGHNCGDSLLQYVSDVLLHMTRESDVVARYAGDEFVIILPETTLKNAKKNMLRIDKYFKKNPFEENNVPLPVSIAYGVASSTEDNIDSNLDILKIADQRLYDEKKKKKENPLIF